MNLEGEGGGSRYGWWSFKFEMLKIFPMNHCVESGSDSVARKVNLPMLLLLLLLSVNEAPRMRISEFSVVSTECGIGSIFRERKLCLEV